jgi:hypothetical protein
MARILYELWRQRRMTATDPALAGRVPPGQTLETRAMQQMRAEAARQRRGR